MIRIKEKGTETNGGGIKRQRGEAQTTQMQWRWHRKANWRVVNDANAMEVASRGKVERRKRLQM